MREQLSRRDTLGRIGGAIGAGLFFTIPAVPRVRAATTGVVSASASNGTPGAEAVQTATTVELDDGQFAVAALKTSGTAPEITVDRNGNEVDFTVTVNGITIGSGDVSISGDKAIDVNANLFKFKNKIKLKNKIDIHVGSKAAVKQALANQPEAMAL